MAPEKRDGVFQRKDRPGSWYVSYMDATGERKKKKVAARTPQQARDALALIKAKVEREKLLGIKEVSDITTADLFRRYRKHQKPHLAPESYERTDAVLVALLGRLPATVRQISKATVAGLIADRGAEVAAGTVQKEVTILKHALRMAVEWELLLSNPADGARLPKLPEGRTRYLSPAELKSALKAAPDWLRAPLALAAFTGMRRGEVMALRWTDIDLDGRRAYLRETKNESMRVVPLNDLAMGVIQSLPRTAASLFFGFTPENLSVATRRLFSDLGIENASFHSLRHTAASWLVMNGVDLFAVGQVLGHKTPRMTQRYSHLSPAYVANAVSKLDSALAGVLGTGDAVGTKTATREDTAKPANTPNHKLKIRVASGESRARSFRSNV